jgi:hypothetical protein
MTIIYDNDNDHYIYICNENDHYIYICNDNDHYIYAMTLMSLHIFNQIH